MTCPTCNGHTYQGYCNYCGFPPDDPESLEATRRQFENDQRELRCLEYHMSIPDGESDEPNII